MFAVLHRVRYLCGCVEESHDDHDAPSVTWVSCGKPNCQGERKRRTEVCP